MIDRYCTPGMADIWSPEARVEAWMEVELAVIAARADLGEISDEEGRTLVSQASALDPHDLVRWTSAREAQIGHDVAAFVDVVQARLDPSLARWFHYGLTSSDVVDTALSMAIRDSLGVLLHATHALSDTLLNESRRWGLTPMLGRTHGQPAEPITFGQKCRLWYYALGRNRSRFLEAKRNISVGKISGTVGMHTTVSRQVERHALEQLGLIDENATQVLPRDLHADVMFALAQLGATLEGIAVEVRTLQRPEIGELAEPFRLGQKGSSAMPHKRNPIQCEQVTGIARLLRSNVGPALENVALWGERDLSHSCVERVILPDSFHLAHHATKVIHGVVRGWSVDAERMMANVTTWGDRSHAELLRLIEAGVPRDQAYRSIQQSRQP